MGDDGRICKMVLCVEDCLLCFHDVKLQREAMCNRKLLVKMFVYC